MFPVVYLWPVEILSPTAGWAAVRGGGEGLWASGGVKRLVETLVGSLTTVLCPLQSGRG